MHNNLRESIDIANGFDAIEAVEMAVIAQIQEVERNSRLAILNAYLFALRVTARSIESFRATLDLEDKL